MIRDRVADSCIHGVLLEHADRTPEALAIWAPGCPPATYVWLARHVVELAATLRALGVERSDRVALVVPDGPAMAVAFLAVSSVACAAPLNPNGRETEFDRSFSELGAKALVAWDDEMPAVAVARARGIRVVRLVPVRGAPAGAISFDDVASSPEGTPTIFPAASDVALVLMTSGTTSRPKIVALSHANLLTSAVNIGASLELSARDRCLDIMPLFHVHGLVGGLLSSLACGASVACPPGFDAPRFFDWMDELAPTWYTAVPTMHQAIVARASAHRDVIARRPLRFIRSSSSALPAEVRLALETEFKAPVIEAYGMTEASHQIASNPLPPGTRKAGSVGVPWGPDIAIVDERGMLVPTGKPGEITIRGASVICAYDGQPPSEATFPEGRLRTGDAGYIDDDGYLFITGRLKETINRGGEKISPREVDEVLLEHASVAQAATFGMPHATLGQDVAAAVVRREGATCTDRELREFVAKRLAPFKVPARIVFLDQLPKGPTGKVQRNQLAEKLGLRADAGTPRPKPAHVAPRSPLEAQIASMWSEILAVPHVGVHDNFFESGGDSVLGARFLARVRRELGADLSFVALFDRPTVADVSAAISSVTANRRDGGAGKDPTTGPPAIVPMARDRFRARRTASELASVIEAPLSFGQQRLWFIEQWQPGTGVFNSRIPLRMRGTLHVKALEQSLAALVRRHGTLRTSFPLRDGQPVQRVASQLSIELPTIDLRDLPPQQQSIEIDRLTTGEMHIPFDLSTGPLVRASLILLGPDDHVLLATVHHIVFDGWSRSVFVNDLLALYTSLVRGESPSLPVLPIQYAEYAKRETQNEELVRRHLAFWKDQLGGELPTLEIARDYPRPSAADLHGATVERTLSQHLTEAIEALSVGESATPYMAMLAAFAALLSRHAGLDDVLIGSPIAGRTELEIERLIGFFVKTLIVRVDVSGDPSFRALLARVRSVALDALDNQDVPFQKLVEHLRVERFANRNPIFDVALNFLNFPDLAVEAPGLTVRYFEPVERKSEFSLTMNVRKAGNRFAIRMVYQRALFSPQRIMLMLDQFESLLEQIVAAPDRPIGVHSLVAPESRKVLPDPAAAIAEPLQQPITAAIFAHADRTPSNAAVSQAGRVWSYGELAQRAAAVSGALAMQRHQPGDVVAVTGNASFGLIASLLGVLASGGVLLPIDPDLPVERKRLMLREARVRTVVHVEDGEDEGDEALAWAECSAFGVNAQTAAPFDVGATSAGPPVAAFGPSGARPVDPASESPAYIFFTSGTSGIPKGVLGSHKGLAHFLAWQRETFGVSPGDRCAHLTGLSFDVVLRDVFLPLVSGATLCLPEWRRHAGRDVLPWLNRERITIVHTVPALAAAWLADRPSDLRLPSLRCVFFAGEPLPDELVRHWREAFPGAGRIVNLYGATEATLAQCFYVVPEHAPEGIQPIGMPLPDTQALVLRRDRGLCGIGERGEIAIRTPFLSLGYVNAHGETRARFIRNPFRDDDSERIYLTGDIGRYRPNGTLETLGRLDDQIKIRGVRVELQEVNLQLLHHPDVKASCVVPRVDENGQPAIVAYVSASQPHSTPSQLRAFISKRLPSAMVPSTFVFLPAMPLTQNGKIDRSALPAPSLFQGRTTVEPMKDSLDNAGESQGELLPEPATPLTEADRHRLLVEWNATAAPFPDRTCLHELVEAQAQRAPHAIAVECGSLDITYQELNSRANQLARLLRPRGIGPDVPVGVSLERSIETVVALLAVLKAGGAFVPLDPSHPSERLKAMLEDAAIRVTVTQVAVSEKLRAPGVELVCLDEVTRTFESESADALENRAGPENLAYVMFTSGSTGRPKGVMIPHRAVSNLTACTRTPFPLTADDRVLHRSSCGFDASIWELFAPLVAGARLIMTPPGAELEPARLVEIIASHHVTFLKVVPSLLSQLIDDPNFSRCKALKRVTSGGEALSRALQERFFDRTDARLYNLYGPTEACVYSTIWTCQRGHQTRDVPIGRPIPNAQVYVLGPSLELVPIGAVGELYIGGAGLARGYIGRPDLTAERFVPNPFSDDPAARLYRTGDRVRYSRDGNLEFLGRFDHQMKIRGVRIEPGEVEAALRGHPGVQAALAMAREDVPGDRRLVAYLVPRPHEPQPNNADLRRFLSGKLSEPMLPSTFVWLEAFPLNQSGKVDRAALPPPAAGRPNLPEAFVAPRTIVEKSLAKIWGDVLRVDPIGIHDDFFELGGHSLMATQVMARISEMFGRNIPLARLFETTTIAALAEVLERTPGK